MFGFFKNELLEVIEWKEDGKDTLIWKFPDKDASIKYGAQLTVRESQAAIFLNEGQIADVYGPGRHTLKTENMPVLTKLKSWKHGFNSPFKADVYFISTRQLTNFKWGTPNPIFVKDPDAGRVEVRAFGTYFIRVTDPKKFYREYAGTSNLLMVDELEDVFRALVVPKFAEALSESGATAFDIYSQYSELGDTIRPLIQKDLEEFGLELTKFQITSVSLPPEITEHMKQMAKLNLTSNENLNKMRAFNQMDVDKIAAEKGNYENRKMTQNDLMMQQMMMQQMMQNQNNSNNNAAGKEEKMSREEIMKTLKELGELKEMGILTEQEFNDKKKELLAKL
ncbi:SPFH domain-containing protein [Aureispira anguillae]|uniref:SPFH domain-containing protein n=1 Tax=Aureispira anguillae TaxID=2864201 RepID=A0A915YHW3_9BACT|nr:SPFH domain-containing protein [Aureispira anguillae]BDS13373.1 SPFH domain-containing protein [Aureispira anguillae]